MGRALVIGIDHHMTSPLKLPATGQGIIAIEEATYPGGEHKRDGQFLRTRAIAIGEAMARGLTRREAAGLSTEDMAPVTTIMIGRTDDLMQVVTKRDGITVNPTCVPWTGIAVLKRAFGVYQERGYRSRLLAAAYRHHLHWSDLIGGDVVVTIPSAWQKLFNDSNVDVQERISDPVAPEIVKELYDRIPDFGTTYDQEGSASTNSTGTGRRCAPSGVSSPRTTNSSELSARISCSPIRT